MSLTPKALQDLLDELEASRRSRRRAWENLEEIRWVHKHTGGIELAPPARKTIDLEGRIVKDGVRKAIKDRQIALDAVFESDRRIPEIHQPDALHQKLADYLTRKSKGPTGKRPKNPNQSGRKDTDAAG
jgi:hypothetical protein